MVSSSVSGLEISRIPEGKLCAFSFTYDDGVQAHYTHALPLHEKYGFPATFLIVTDRVENDADEARAHKNCSWSELKAMADKGMEIASHTKSHRNMREIESAGVTKEMTQGKAREEVLAMREKNWPALLEEVTGSKKAIEEHCGTPVRTYAFSGNACPDWTWRLMAEVNGYVRAGCIRIATGRGDTEASYRKQIDEKVVRTNQVSCVMIHGVGTKEPGDGWNPIPDLEVYESLFKLVTERVELIHVGTYGENAAYSARVASTKLVKQDDEGKVFVLQFAKKPNGVCEPGEVWLRVAQDEKVSVNGKTSVPNKYGAVLAHTGDMVTVSVGE